MLETDHPKAEPGSAFQNLQATYGLLHPGQIKMHILWIHVQQLMKAQYDGPENQRTLEKYDREWKLCEGEENKRT